ncbi:IS4 family transposase [Microbispora sp. NBC_01389]|uniref:IS4 family transposase n=1 Tax=Microbispora sp. NBC_01389 TaxID=2903584 RepID=UPI00386F6FEE
MRTDSATTTTLTRTLTVAGGVFAPGHLGELTQHLPFELVDAVLEDTGKIQRRLRNLPSRVGVYFVLALGLFPELGYVGVWGKLVAALEQLGLPRPCEKALRDLRRRVGVAPLRALFEIVAGPLAQPATPGARYRRWRTVAFDGCSSIKVPDAERNRSWLGKIKHRLGWAGYPTVMLMTLVETGTRGLLGAVFGPATTGESRYARRLCALLGADMLVLADRAFDGNDLLAAVAGRGAQFLVRLKSTRRPPLAARLCDGSFLSKVGEVVVRIIDADITVICADGTKITGRYRLATTLLDPRRDRAAALIRLYHERWEIESAYLALRHTLLGGRVLRSGDPIGLEQELWALLTVYQALRMAMVAAAESVPGTDPDRACFTIAMQTARDQVILASGVLPADPAAPVDLVGVIGRAILDGLLPPRRPRISVRKVKSPISRYHARPQDDERPLTSQNVVGVLVVVHEGQTIPPPLSAPPQPPEQEQEQEQEQADDTQPATSRKDQVLALLRADPGRSWRGRELAQVLRIANLNSFCVQLSQWASKGLIYKIAPAVYALTPPAASINGLSPAETTQLTMALMA